VSKIIRINISLNLDDVELVATIVEERLAEVLENVERHMASIADQVKEVKVVLEQLGIEATHEKETPTQAKEGVSVPETVQFAAQSAANFIITMEMMFIDEEIM
jgi:hypothetical protein